ncbi:MAG: hypothetical protein KIT84_23025 [Labilithrix sp.]|nr:hypothetical protein [Labilithrix sp.]
MLARRIAEEVEHCRHVCKGDAPSDLEACASKVPIRTELPAGKEREIAYQVDIGNYCGAPGVSSCSNRLIARANVDYTAAASQVVAQHMSPAQYLALARDRTRKLRRAEDDARTAIALCNSPDSDGDWVVDANDRCPNTPDLTATDDRGCPLTTLPQAPPAADVAKLLDGMNLAVSPHCKGATVPQRIPAGAFYYPSALERGTYILAGAVENQPPGCPIWYEFDLEESNGFHYGVIFLDRESKADLVDLGRPVPSGFIQFNPRPTDTRPGQQRLATTAGKVGLRYRVRAMNGNGLRGPWSDWKISDRSSCTALGFTCGDR